MVSDRAKDQKLADWLQCVETDWLYRNYRLSCGHIFSSFHSPVSSSSSSMPSSVCPHSQLTICLLSRAVENSCGFQDNSGTLLAPRSCNHSTHPYPAVSSHNIVLSGSNWSPRQSETSAPVSRVVVLKQCWSCGLVEVASQHSKKRWVITVEILFMILTAARAWQPPSIRQSAPFLLARSFHGPSTQCEPHTDRLTLWSCSFLCDAVD